MNGDGFDDLIVGAYSDDNNGQSSGSARVFSGVDGSVLYTFFGDSTGDVFGWSVDGAGDVNLDGHADLIVGAKWDDDGGAESGSARVFSGADGSILYNFYGGSSRDQFGVSVAGAGDVNRDGFADVIVGEWLDNDNGTDSGSASVLSGADGSLIYRFHGDSVADYFGVSVNGAGDVDRDGYADLIIGAYCDDDTGTDAGSAKVMSGATGAVLFTFFGDLPMDHFGLSVAGAGDVNDDGHDDLIVGTRYDDDGALNAGSARVFSGADGAILNTFYGASTGDALGSSVAGAGDYNADGFDDLIVGAMWEDSRGGAQVYSGFRCCPGASKSCTILPCYDCPTMAARTVGRPELGNTSFALELVRAPYNATFAILAIGSGFCHPKGIQTNFCDAIRVGTPTILVGAPLGAGLGFCGTTAQVSAPIPVIPALVGTEYGIQWAVSCGSSTPGTSITNCTSFVVTN